jgi:hypothetical protein
VDCLAQVIRGNIEWSLRVPRYGWEEHVEWSATPSDDNPDPIPAPAISWWWQELN